MTTYARRCLFHIFVVEGGVVCEYPMSFCFSLKIADTIIVEQYCALYKCMESFLLKSRHFGTILGHLTICEFLSSQTSLDRET